jgi:hypothetical protein
VDSFGSTRRRRQLAAAEAGALRVEKLGEAGGALTGMLGDLAATAAAQGLGKEQVCPRRAALCHAALPYVEGMQKRLRSLSSTPGHSCHLIRL